MSISRAHAQTATLVADVDTPFSDGLPTMFEISPGVALFNMPFSTGNQVWRSDGSPEGTFRVYSGVPVLPDRPGAIGNVTVQGGEMFFPADDENGQLRIWKTNGTSLGTVSLMSIDQHTVSFGRILESRLINNVMYFTGFDAVHGKELWSADLSTEQVRLVKDIEPGTGSGLPHGFMSHNGLLLFVAVTSAHGFELWRSDGTEQGTFMVKDILPGPDGSGPAGFMNFSGEIYFFTNFGNTLWKTNGTHDGTTIVADLDAMFGNTLLNVIEGGDKLYFMASNSIGIWDGTMMSIEAAGFPQPITSISHSKKVGSKLFFIANDSFRQINGMNLDFAELYASDGTPGGTSRVAELPYGAHAIGIEDQQFSDVNGRLYFSAGHVGRESSFTTLWTSDGTSQGTHPVSFTQPDPPIMPGKLHGAGRYRVFFAAPQDEFRPQLYRLTLPDADGTGACCTAGQGNTCSITTMQHCEGLFLVDRVCEPELCCPANFNTVDGLTVQDIFDFLASWFSQSPRADFNTEDGVTVQDIFDFLAAWFAGC